MENHVKIYQLLADGHKNVTEIKTDVFLESIRLIRQSDNYQIGLGVVEIILPANIMTDMICNVLMMLPNATVRTIMENMEQSFR